MTTKLNIGDSVSFVGQMFTIKKIIIDRYRIKYCVDGILPQTLHMCADEFWETDLEDGIIVKM